VAMKKAEMQQHHAQYESLIAQAQAARREGLFQKAIQLALAAGEHIDGMMQYELAFRRFSCGSGGGGEERCEGGGNFA